MRISLPKCVTVVRSIDRRWKLKAVSSRLGVKLYLVSCALCGQATSVMLRCHAVLQGLGGK